MSNSRIMHVSTVHQALDNRIYYKEVRSLRAAGFDVLFAAQRGDSSESPDVVLQTRKNKIGRFFLGFFEVISVARRVRAGVIHFHDPELIPAAIVLKMFGKRVIYDVHENISAQIMTKHTIPPILRRLLATCAGFFEMLGKLVFDGFVCATPDIHARFPKERAVLVQNWPRLEEFALTSSPSFQADTANSSAVLKLVYVGGLTEIRGAMQMLDAVELVGKSLPVEFTIMGSVHPDDLLVRMRAHPAWKHVNYLGWCDRKTVVEKLKKSDIGLVLFQPAPNHLASQPNKLFEYMAAELPVVASHFSWWKKVIDGSGCGKTADPTSPKEIADAVLELSKSSTTRKAMGRKGRQQVEQVYNWGAEFVKLKKLYSKLNISVEETA